MHAEIGVCIDARGDDPTHRARPAAPKYACTSAQGCTCGEHIVDKRDRRPVVVRRDRKRATHLQSSGCWRRAALVHVATRARHDVQHRNVPQSPQVARDFRSRVESAQAHALCSARHGNQHPARRFHACDDQLRQCAGDTSPSTVFECVDERARRAGVDHPMADPVELVRTFRAGWDRNVPRMPTSGACAAHRTDQLTVAVIAQVVSGNAAGCAGGGQDEFEEAAEHTSDRARATITRLCQNRTSLCQFTLKMQRPSHRWRESASRRFPPRLPAKYLALATPASPNAGARNGQVAEPPGHLCAAQLNATNWPLGRIAAVSAARGISPAEVAPRHPRGSATSHMRSSSRGPGHPQRR